ncbi:MAG: hypothetical protein K0S34_1441 [Bacillales bacterium]|nr:hypothetical protein [Bacillales bacterium]
MDFLVFPDNKLEYIPALITFILFIIASLGILKIFIEISKKEEININRLQKTKKGKA